MKQREVERVGSKGSVLYFVSKNRIEREEPFLKADLALCSPSTGIVDSHAFMDALRSDIERDGSNGMIQLRTKVIRIEKVEGGYLLYLSDGSVVKSPVVINAAGLMSEHVARMLWMNHQHHTNSSPFPDEYRIYYYKGQYFKYCPQGSSPSLGTSRMKINRLVYPVPDKGLIGLGIHATIDLQGNVKFGPDSHFERAAFTEWETRNMTEEMLSRDEVFDYRVNPLHSSHFHSHVATYLKHIAREDIVADYSGMRPKLNPRGDTKFRDFIIREESNHGFPGFINLLGMESPGLTSSLSIANYVAHDLLGYPSTHNFG